MQTCTECGTRNPAGAEFCSQCNTFLAWDQQRLPPHVPAPTVPHRPAPPPDPPPSRTETTDPSPHRGRPPTQYNPETVHRLPPVPVGQDDRTVALPRVPDHEPGLGPGRGTSSGTGGSHRWDDPTPPDGRDTVATPSKVRGPGSIPPSRQPEPIPPGDTRPPLQRSPEQPSDVPGPGEVECPRCGAGNSRERHFCRRCAAELHQDVRREVPPPPPPPRAGPSPVAWVLVVLAAIVILWLLIDL